jgi:hypothetical protein
VLAADASNALASRMRLNCRCARSVVLVMLPPGGETSLDVVAGYVPLFGAQNTLKQQRRLIGLPLVGSWRAATASACHADIGQLNW